MNIILINCWTYTYLCFNLLENFVHIQSLVLGNVWYVHETTFSFELGVEVLEFEKMYYKLELKGLKIWNKLAQTLTPMKPPKKIYNVKIRITDSLKMEEPQYWLSLGNLEYLLVFGVSFLYIFGCFLLSVSCFVFLRFVFASIV